MARLAFARNFDRNRISSLGGAIAWLSIFWNVTTSGDWDVASNWTPETVPGAGDDAVLGAIGFSIAQPYTVTVTASINVDDVVISDTNAVLLDSGPVTVAIATDLTDAGYLNVEYGGSTTIKGAVNNTGTIDVDTQGGGDPSGGSILTIDGALTNSAVVNIGGASLASATKVDTAALDNSGTINITGGSSTLATLSVGAAAPSTLDGTFNLTGDALLEYASGAIATIGSGADLTFNGSQARVAVATGSTTTSSALTGLSQNDGAFELEGGATVTLTGLFTNAGTLQSFTGATATMAAVDNSATFDVADGGSATTTGNFDNTASIDVDSSDGQSGGVLTIGGTLTNSGSLNMGANVESGSTTVNVEGAGGVDNTGTIDLADNRSPGSTDQATLDVANAAAGFGVAGQVTGTVSLVGDSLIEFKSGGITQVDSGASLSLDGGGVATGDRRCEHRRQHRAERARRERRRLLGGGRRDGHDDGQFEQHRQYLRRQFRRRERRDADDRRDADQQRQAQHGHECRDRLDDGEHRGRRRHNEHWRDRSLRRQVAGVDQSGDARCGECSGRLRNRGPGDGNSQSGRRFADRVQERRHNESGLRRRSWRLPAASRDWRSPARTPRRTLR